MDTAKETWSGTWHTEWNILGQKRRRGLTVVCESALSHYVIGLVLPWDKKSQKPGRAPTCFLGHPLRVQSILWWLHRICISIHICDLLCHHPQATMVHVGSRCRYWCVSLVDNELHVWVTAGHATSYIHTFSRCELFIICVSMYSRRKEKTSRGRR